VDCDKSWIRVSIEDSMSGSLATCGHDGRATFLDCRAKQ
jgi:hypothetical protein